MSHEINLNQNQIPPFNLDKAQISQTLHIPLEVFERIVRNSFPPTERDINDLEVAVLQSDFTKIHQIAHRLKGTYSNLRIGALSSIAEKINDISKTTQNQEGIAQITALLKNFKTNLVEIKKLFP